MIVVIKSAPGTQEASRGVRVARDMAADLALLQDGVYLARKGMLEGFCGTAHVLGEDLRMRGIKDLEKYIRVIDHSQLVDLLSEAENVMGTF
jgi:sulfur relay protein TusB/DsrH